MKETPERRGAAPGRQRTVNAPGAGAGRLLPRSATNRHCPSFMLPPDGEVLGVERRDALELEGGVTHGEAQIAAPATSTNRGSQLTTSFGPPVKSWPMASGPKMSVAPAAIAVGAAKCSKAGPLPSSTERAEKAASVASSVAAHCVVGGRCGVPPWVGVPKPSGSGSGCGPPRFTTKAAMLQPPLSVRRQ